MDSDGTRDARGTHANPVPRARSDMPPMPTDAPLVPPRQDGSAFLAWLRAPRPDAAPGIWRFGHRPRPAEEPEEISTRQLLSGALIAFLVGWLVWSLLQNGYLGAWWALPFKLLVPDSWRYSSSEIGNLILYKGYELLIALVIMVTVGKLGRWGEVWRRFVVPLVKRPEPRQAPAPVAEEDPAQWNELRAAGAHDAADRLTVAAQSGQMRDVDHARIARAWQGVRSGRFGLGTFTGAVLQDGAAACLHPSGERDLPARLARHDLLTGQVRLGTTADDARNPYAYRGTGLGLGPELLGTSLLAVGPAGSGKTGTVIRPLAESLCLHALAGRAAVVVVGAAGAGLGPADAYDVVVQIGNPESVYDLDLYGGTADPDEAAAVLAEALVGDLAEPHQGATPGGPPPCWPSSSDRSGRSTAASPPYRSCVSCSTGRRGRWPRCARGSRTPGRSRCCGNSTRGSGRWGIRGMWEASSRTGSRCSTGPPSRDSSTRQDSRGRSR